MQSVDSRVDQLAGSRRLLFDNRMSLALLIWGIFLSIAWFHRWPMSLPQGMGLWTRAVTVVVVIALVGVVIDFLLTLLLSPLIEGYYLLVYEERHRTQAALVVLEEELKARRPGYVQTVTRLLSDYRPPALQVRAVARIVFEHLLDAGLPGDALDVGEALGLPPKVVNRARHALLERREAGRTSRDAPDRFPDARAAAREILTHPENLEALVAHQESGEMSAPAGNPARIVRRFAELLSPLDELPGETVRQILPEAQVRELARLHRLLGQWNRNEGEEYQAIYQYERAIELFTDEPQARFLLSQLHYQMGSFSLALSAVDAHLRHFPEDVLAQLHRKDCLHRLKRTWNQHP